MNKKCERCHMITFRLYDIYYLEDETGEDTIMKVCWDCEWELTNGRGTLFQEAWEIWQNREEENL